MVSMTLYTQRASLSHVVRCSGRDVKRAECVCTHLCPATELVGGHYEVTGSQVTKYYFAGTTRIAMRKYTIPQNMSVEYFLGDHLGSTSITTDANGAKVSEMRYKAWGELRYSWTAGQSTTPAYRLADYTYTGQFSYMDDPSTSGVTEGFGLMFYNARWYDPALGRFAQADTITPRNIQGLDRYAYTNNNPIRYIDPSGHYACDDRHDCETKKSTACSVGSGVFNGNFTCTPDDLNKATISQRQSWFRGMLNFANPDLVAEFSNINGILAAFQVTNTGAPGSWASWGDAGILASIQNGLYMSENEIDKPISTNAYGAAADTAWKDYFDSFRDDRFSNTTDQLWGVAEGAGTTYGRWLAQEHGQTKSTGEMLFLYLGDKYRGLACKQIWP